MAQIDDFRRMLEQAFPVERLRSYLASEGLLALPDGEAPRISLVSIVLLLEHEGSPFSSACRVQVALGEIKALPDVTAERGFATLFFDAKGEHIKTKVHARMDDY